MTWLSFLSIVWCVVDALLYAGGHGSASDIVMGMVVDDKTLIMNTNRRRRALKLTQKRETLINPNSITCATTFLQKINVIIMVGYKTEEQQVGKKLLKTRKLE